MPCCFLYLYDLVCSYLRCRFACVSAVFSNFRLLWILSDLQVPTGAALLRSPRLFAPSVEGGEIVLAAVRTTENACTADRRKLGCTDGRSAERQRVVEVHQIVSHPPMAASEAMPPRRALPLPRRRTPSCCKLPMEFSLGGSKGGISLFEKEISLPCPCSAIGAALPPCQGDKTLSCSVLKSGRNALHSHPSSQRRRTLSPSFTSKVKTSASSVCALTR